jgi:heme ABC exporter ATP-binding subunit CcmA
MDRTAALDLHGIAKLYGRTAAVRAVDLRLDRGETLALLGPNGSGKTTLLKIVAGAVAPSLGRGHILGRDMRSERAALRREIGLLAAESYLYEELTAQENLRFAAVTSGRRPQEGQIERLLEEVGLLAHADERVRSFSSGMQRRLALARAVLGDPALLLLDEPYNSLDAAGADLVDAVVRTWSGAGRAVILATHDQDRALAVAHRVAVMRRGALLYDGPAGAYKGGHAQHVV